ncbi:hypothetical protein [Micromonospora tarensis]|uniref:Uncharacterized protein n=1 Tax=Micromonospora tarensis TaxID=2806100 RepID=A0ABS1YLZ0_9ACTN|nr:hypothetical protein [Micromonospora tarensis]MBM0278455.1 hypothetical protein [Micromonospora tarensis]
MIPRRLGITLVSVGSDQEVFMGTRWLVGTLLTGFCVAVLLEAGFPETIVVGGSDFWLTVASGAVLLVRLLARRAANRVLRVAAPSAASASRENQLAQLCLVIDAEKRSVVMTATYVTNSK